MASNISVLSGNSSWAVARQGDRECMSDRSAASGAVRSLVGGAASLSHCAMTSPLPRPTRRRPEDPRHRRSPRQPRRWPDRHVATIPDASSPLRLARPDSMYRHLSARPPMTGASRRPPVPRNRGTIRRSRVQRVIVTGVPGPMCWASQVMFAVLRRTQPWDAAVPGMPPMLSVPWSAI
jgi:hypothetical protein